MAPFYANWRTAISPKYEFCLAAPYDKHGLRQGLICTRRVRLTTLRNRQMQAKNVKVKPKIAALLGLFDFSAIKSATPLNGALDREAERWNRGLRGAGVGVCPQRLSSLARLAGGGRMPGQPPRAGDAGWC